MSWNLRLGKGDFLSSSIACTGERFFTVGRTGPENHSIHLSRRNQHHDPEGLVSVVSFLINRSASTELSALVARQSGELLLQQVDAIAALGIGKLLQGINEKV